MTIVKKNEILGNYVYGTLETQENCKSERVKKSYFQQKTDLSFTYYFTNLLKNENQ